MTQYISVRSNWASINSISLDQICDIDIEDLVQSTIIKTDNINDNENISSRKTTSSDDTVRSITLKSSNIDEHEDPKVIFNVVEPEKYSISSIQILSNAKYVEFYHQEYIGSSQGSRITELDSESIYEISFEFEQIHNEITLKFLRLANIDELIIYCLQVNMNKLDVSTSPISITSLPFDLNRVRLMINETNLSANARQFMNDLQHIQEQRRTKQTSSQDLNLNSMMSMFKALQPSNSMTRHLLSTNPTSTANENKLENDKTKQEFNELEKRLQNYIDERFVRLQQHIDDRFNRLEKMLFISSIIDRSHNKNINDKYVDGKQYTIKILGQTYIQRTSNHGQCEVELSNEKETSKRLSEGQLIQLEEKWFKVEDCRLRRAYVAACGSYLFRQIKDLVCSYVEQHQKKKLSKRYEPKNDKIDLLNQSFNRLCCNTACTVHEIAAYCF